MKKFNLIVITLITLVLSTTTFATVSLELSTGVNVSAPGNPLYINPARDANWIVRTTPGGVVNQPGWIKYGMGGWNNIPGTLPIFGNTDAPGTSEYERCFCITNLDGAKLDVSMRADNKANLYVNSYFNPILPTVLNNTFNTALSAVSSSYTASNGLKLGKNCIRVRVNNESGLTGFAVKATAQVQAGQDTYQENGCCKQGSPVFSEQLRKGAGDVLEPTN